MGAIGVAASQDTGAVAERLAGDHKLCASADEWNCKVAVERNQLDNGSRQSGKAKPRYEGYYLNRPWPIGTTSTRSFRRWFLPADAAELTYDGEDGP
jgi:hypothetical protein